MFKKVNSGMRRGNRGDHDTTADGAARRHPSAAGIEKSRLIVGPNIKLKGVEITDCDTLVVEGRVEASMDSRVIQIADGGMFTGTVAVDRAEDPRPVRGRDDGARAAWSCMRRAGVPGKVRYGRMAVEEGGERSSAISRPCRGATPPVAIKTPTEAGQPPVGPARALRPSGTGPAAAAPASKNGGHAQPG